MKFLKTVLVWSVFFWCVNFLIWHLGDPMPAPGPEPVKPSVIPDAFINCCIVFQLPSYYLAALLLPRSFDENINLLFVSIFSGVGYALVWRLVTLVWRKRSRKTTQMTTVNVIVCFSLALSCLLSGCTNVATTGLAEQRRQLSAAYQDKQKPIAERVKAFDDLLETFTDGTREDVMDRYIAYVPGDIKGRVAPPEAGDFFSLNLTAPDGSHRYVPMKGDRVKYN